MKNNQLLGLNGRLNYMGGECISPVLIDKSIDENQISYDESKAFDEQLPSLCYLDLSITYNINKLNHSSVWAFQVKNVLGSPMYEGFAYNYKTENIQAIQTVIVLPMLSYRIEF